MSRRKGAEKRGIEADPRYGNMLVAKFTNGLMQRGKKSLARRIFYDAMDIVNSRVPDEEPMAIFE
ncbi:MAG: 30S ribosomal protein S7, partial [Desulfofustis sp.]|nr:30S ribosomal protein S7 [Desulfofustis sp.]